MAKILYSPGFGAGWSTWHYGTKNEKIFFLTYQPLIDAIEKYGNGSPEFDEALSQFRIDYEKNFNPDTKEFDSDDLGYLGGSRDLTVTEVNSLFRINEYDGSETVEIFNPTNYIHPATLPVTKKCNRGVYWWDGEYEGQCELSEGHSGHHYDGMSWFDDENECVDRFH